MFFIAQLIIILALLYLLCFKVIPITISFHKGVPPFIPTRSGAVSEIIPLLKLKPKSILYDLGCGDGRILIEALKSEPDVTAIGVDNDWIPVLAARFRSRGKNIRIVHADIFKTPLKDATHIYCYLFPGFLAKLEPKILAECRRGTRIVSCDFMFPNMKPIETIEITSRKFHLAKMAYVYVI